MIVLNSVCIVVGQLGNGGLERQLSILIPDLLARGVDVKCVVWNYSMNDFYSTELSKLLGDNLVGFPYKEGSFSKLIRLRRIIRKDRPKLTLSYTTFLNAAVHMASIGLSKSVGSLRTSAKLYSNTGGFKASLNLRYPAHILVNSKRAINELKLLYPGVQAAYLANVIELNRLKPTDQPNILKRSLSIGNVREVKRLDRLLDLMEYLKNKGHNPQHTHVGGGQGLENLKKMALAKGLSEHINFVGPKSNVVDYLHSHSVFLHFADYEGSPNVIMEAMAAGLPVITTDCGDAAEYVQDGKNGYVVRPFAVETFGNHLIDLYANTDLRASMSASGLALIANNDVIFVGDIFMDSLNELNLNVSYPA